MVSTAKFNKITHSYTHTYTHTFLLTNAPLCYPSLTFPAILYIFKLLFEKNYKNYLTIVVLITYILYIWYKYKQLMDPSTLVAINQESLKINWIYESKEVIDCLLGTHKYLTQIFPVYTFKLQPNSTCNLTNQIYYVNLTNLNKQKFQNAKFTSFYNFFFVLYLHPYIS